MRRFRVTPSSGADPIEARLRQVRRRRAVRALLASLTATATVVVVLFGVFLAVAVVDGGSMTPTLKDGDVLVFQRVGVTYQAGDIALVRTSDGTEQVKRIVATPGQTVDIDEDTGEVLVDGVALLEPYVYEDTLAKRGVSYPFTLGEDEYFVLGDNRGNSRDSRNYGAVSADQLDGRLLFIAFRWER